MPTLEQLNVLIESIFGAFSAAVEAADYEEAENFHEQLQTLAREKAQRFGNAP